MAKDTFRAILCVITKGLVAVALVTLLSIESLIWARVPLQALTQSGSASISGTVMDSSGAILAGANISARNSINRETRQTSSVAEGKYLISGLPAGKYVLTVTASQFQPTSKEVSVGAGQSVTADFHFSLQPLRES